MSNIKEIKPINKNEKGNYILEKVARMDCEAFLCIGVSKNKDIEFFWNKMDSMKFAFMIKELEIIYQEKFSTHGKEYEV